MIAKGINEISAIYKGDVKFAKAYLGADLLWSAITSVDWIELRISTDQRVFNSGDIDEVDSWAGGATPAVAKDYDLSGNGNHAYNATTLEQPAFDSNEQALLPDGSDDYLITDYTEAISTFTIVASVKPDSVGDGDKVIVAKYNSIVNERSIATYINGTAIGIIISDNGTALRRFETGGIIIGDWNRVAYTYDGILLKIYLNGVILDTFSSELPLATTQPLEIFSVNQGLGALSDNLTKMIRIDSRAWTGQEVLDDFNGISPLETDVILNLAI